MGFDVMSKIEGGIGDKMSQLSNSLPGGKIPMAADISGLKGTLPNMSTLKGVFSQKSTVPTEFQKDFQADDLISVIGVTTPPVNEIDLKPSDPKIEPEIDVKKLKEEGLTDEQIAKEQRKKEIRQKRNEVAAEIQNKLKSGVENFANNMVSSLQTQAVGAILGGLDKSGGCGVSLLARIAAFKYFKAQMGTINERTNNIKGEISKLKDTGKDLLKGVTESIKTSGKLTAESAKLEGEAKAAEAPTKMMKPTGVSHPGLGNKANSGATQKSREAKDKAEGFAKNLKQTLNNVGKVIKGIMGAFKGLFGLIIKAIGAILSIISFIAFLKQMLELLMLIFMKNDACANSGNPSGQASPNSLTPEQFLSDIGYPGYGSIDYSTLINNITAEMNQIELPSNPFPNINYGNIGDVTFEPDITLPIMIGVTQLGIPLNQEDLDPTISGKTFDSHPILGDISDINPQLINELYEEGILPKINKDKPNQTAVEQYAKDLDKLYDDTVEELQNTQQLEYIEKLYNMNFEMIGYRRYEA